MNNKQVKWGLGLSLGCLVLGSSLYILSSKNHNKLGDEALLSIIKNDQPAFENFMKQGGDTASLLPLLDGYNFTVAEGIAYFERVDFIKYLQKEKKTFIEQDPSKGYDILSLTVRKNNAELLSLMLKENPVLNHTYGSNEWSLLHIASAECSHKLVALLHQSGKLNWDIKAKDGSTPLTLAAEKECLPVLSYWKENKADFKAKDARGLTALSILKKKKDAALLAFAQSFESRSPASVGVAEVNFYKKRVFPKDKALDDSLLEPGDRPEEANETAEYSEFSD